MPAVGHREALLEGAKHCLRERGYARTTARDIVAASSTNLGSIGYHFGSKEALLTEAIIESFEEFGDALAGALAETPPAGDPYERFAARCSRVIEAMMEHRGVWAASVEAFIQSQHLPAVRERLGEALEMGRTGLASLLEGIPENAPEARAVGSLHLALLDGLMIQWLVDPERAPSGEDLAAGLRTILGRADPPSSEA